MNTKTSFARRTAIACACALALPAYDAAAKVYTCLQNGSVVYTSSPKGNCSVANLPEIGRYSDAPRSYAPAVASSSSAKRAARAKPRTVSNRGSVGAATPAVNIVPRGSDNSRRAILQQELANEQRALAQAQQALSQGRAMKNSNYGQYQANVRRLESAVLDRRQNIQALQRELGRM